MAITMVITTSVSITMTVSSNGSC